MSRVSVYVARLFTLTSASFFPSPISRRGRGEGKGATGRMREKGVREAREATTVAGVELRRNDATTFTYASDTYLGRDVWIIVWVLGRHVPARTPVE